MARRTLSLIVAACVAACVRPLDVVRAADWTGYGGNAQHTALSTVASQPLSLIKWSTPIDLAPQYGDNGDLYIHYGSPSITAQNTVIMPVKTTATGGFQLQAFNGATGTPLWTQPTDYTLPQDGGAWPSYWGWTPSYSAGLASATNTLYYPGAGGTVYARTGLDTTGNVTPTQVAFYGLANYQASAAAKAAFDNNIAISTPITTDAQGDIFFGYSTTGAVLPGVNNGAPLTSGIARISAAGVGTYFQAASLTVNGVSAGMNQIQTNSAPALSNDGTALYVTMSQGNAAGRLVELNSTTLAPMASTPLIDPVTHSPGAVLNLSTASPMVGPDGDVYMGVMDNQGTSRGWMEHFSGDLSTAKATGAFGWDDTASVVPASMVPSYSGTSTYLIMTKYNNYVETGGNGVNMIAILDPNATQPDTRYNGTGATVMKEVLTIAGVTPDTSFPNNPGAVREWCINSAAVDPLTDSVLVNNEDGKLYRWNLGTNSLTQVITLTGGLGEAYTPTMIGPDGTVYAINAGSLYAVGVLPAGTLAGDANQDGMLSVDDYLALDRGALEHVEGWATGDFNSDGTVNAADYAILDAAYAGSPPGAFDATSVPEPASCVLLLAGGVGLIWHRSQRGLFRPRR